VKIAIGADHGGYEMKEAVKEYAISLGHEIDDIGCFSLESVDYPVYANKVCELIQKKICSAGILICGTGIGMSMVANSSKGIRAALCHDEYTARMSREHNNANVLCMGARVIGTGVAEGIVKTWLNTVFAGGRHQRRIEQFNK
jgi:ribose 5-phosphate isomerase B